MGPSTYLHTSKYFKEIPILNSQSHSWNALFLSFLQDFKSLPPKRVPDLRSHIMGVNGSGFLCSLLFPISLIIFPSSSAWRRPEETLRASSQQEFFPQVIWKGWRRVCKNLSFKIELNGCSQCSNIPNTEIFKGLKISLQIYQLLTLMCLLLNHLTSIVIRGLSFSYFGLAF